MSEQDSPSSVIDVTLDEALGQRRRPEVEQERAVAIHDLLSENHVALVNGPAGPYRLQLGMDDGRLLLSLSSEAGEHLQTFGLALGPFRGIVKDYFRICESYYDAIKHASAAKIEAIDMGRRGVHDEGSRLLQERLEGKVEVDFPTARRLFTLLCALAMRG